MAFKVNETVIKLGGKKIPKYGGEKKNRQEIETSETPSRSQV